jgi:LacI family transcriptional regulator
LAKITIDDVARRAGVSIKTVSRVLNNEPFVRVETRDKVLAAVTALDFTPNISARALAGAKAYLIGLLFDNPSPAYVAALEQGALKVCRASGRHLLVEQVSDQGPDLARRLAVLLRTVRMDGVILTPPICDRIEALDALDAAKTPYVRIAPSQAPERSARVYGDDRRAAYDMTSRLIALGHRRIGFVAGPPEHLAAAERRRGFLDAMHAAGLEVPDVDLGQGSFTFRSGLEAAERLLALDPRPTAIFCANDDMAFGVMAQAHRLRLDLPGDLSIAGFDDTPTAEIVWPRLTTVRQPVVEMGEAAAEFLINPPKLEDGAPPPAQLMPFDLVERESTTEPWAG